MLSESPLLVTLEGLCPSDGLTVQIENSATATVRGVTLTILNDFTDVRAKDLGGPKQVPSDPSTSVVESRSRGSVDTTGKPDQSAGAGASSGVVAVRDILTSFTPEANCELGDEADGTTPLTCEFDELQPGGEVVVELNFGGSSALEGQFTQAISVSGQL
jgi:hypothetical protein